MGIKNNKRYYRSVCWKCRSIRNPNYHFHYRNYQQSLKKKVITHYGGKCACCGEENISFLTIDHINGKGSSHRRQIGGGGTVIYRWLNKNHYPKEYQVLCFNCNCGRHINGGICPHKILTNCKANTKLSL